MADARGILGKIRSGARLTEYEIFSFAQGLADGAVSDAQAGAFAMAVCLNGLSAQNRVHLTHGMVQSGQVLTWDIDGPLVDKHSTGGVGDCVSLVLAPALAACGAFVPMISGRGLGHTGGTLDKLGTIPGLKTALSVADFQEIVADIGCAIVGASPEIAPADRRLYAIRDVTGTVASVDLITASILSKKLAAGLEALVLDIKCGSGAFMQTPQEALVLAQALVDTAQGAGVMASALVTDMNQPLAPAAGNALELAEVMAVLTGAGAGSALYRVTLALGGEALAAGGLARDAAEGEARLARAIASGAAAEVFSEMVAAQGGPFDFVERWPDRLPSARHVVDVFAPEAGHVEAIDTRALGEIVVHLGGGRKQEGDRIDTSVGLSKIAPIGAPVDSETPLLRLHGPDSDLVAQMAGLVREAFRLSPKAVTPPALIHERIG